MLLAIDTCGTTGTAALGRFADAKIEILGQVELPAKRNSSDLIPQLRVLLAEHAVSLPQIDTLVVVSGPGSFTGVRIGLSTVKGLAEALHRPVVAVSRLAVLAWKADAETAVLDAGRGEFYFGTYRKGIEKRETLLTAQQMREQSADLTGHPAVCEEPVQAALPPARLVAAPTAADALGFALPRLLSAEYDDSALLDANYLRRSDAELFAKPGAKGSHP